MGIDVIESVYPGRSRSWTRVRMVGAHAGVMDVRVAINHQGNSAIVLAVNLKPLVDEARRVDGIIEVAPRVGDFVSVGEPVFHGAWRRSQHR